MTDDIKGTWEEVFRGNEQELRDLEARVLASRYRELHIWKDDILFTIAKGTTSSTERWQLYANGDYYYADSMEDALWQATQLGYGDIFSWCAEWNDR